MSYHNVRNSRGVALLAALFVLMILSILGIWLLFAVTDEQRLSKSAENAERALKIAEAGIQIARSTFADSGLKNITSTMELSAVDGFYRGGYFLAQLQSGFQGEEKWKDWRYDEGVGGTNLISNISAPVFHVWQTGSKGVNGSFTGTNFYANPIYGIVARGTYFPIEYKTSVSNTSATDTKVRAHDEYTGAPKVDVDYEQTGFGSKYYWIGDKKLDTTLDGRTVNYAVNMSPMVSFSNYSSRTGLAAPVLDQQTAYFTYSGSSSANPSGTGTTISDLSSTVRLRAVNALCHGGGYNDTAHDGNNEPVKTLWEFDTNLHGIGTAPAFFDPTPGQPGDEILYFAVMSRGRPGASGALDLVQGATGRFPLLATHDPEQIYLFAVVDTTGKPADCASTGTRAVKWARPFPDPDVAEWTDYATEHVTGTTGQNDDPANRGASYTRTPADMTPFLPEEDLLADYRDGPGRDSQTGRDNQWNQIRGNLYGSVVPGVSPPVVKVLYRKSTGELTEKRADAQNQYDPIIDIYVTYSALTRVSFLVKTVSDPTVSNHWYGQYVESISGAGWGPAGYRKGNTAQVRVLALRDRLARDTTNNTWKWTAAKSRFPILKWTAPAPAWDPDQSDSTPDGRPWNGYGEYTWDTFFSYSLAPMINTLAWDQDKTLWANIPNAGKANLYNVIYPYYKSAAFVNAAPAHPNNTDAGRRGPSTTEGSPKDFSGSAWADNRIMVMAFRDTWDDYMQGRRTNILGVNLQQLNLGLSNPVEAYWTHTDAKGVGGTGALDFTTAEKTLLTYNATINAPYRTNTAKVGWPRPYVWSESLWTANVRNTAPTQGWQGAGTGATIQDVSVTDNLGETAALCTQCRNFEGIMVLGFSQTLMTSACSTSCGGLQSTDRKDFRLHGIDATRGLHVWDYHLPAYALGNTISWSPAIANNLVFAAYEKFGDKTIADNRQARLLILDAGDGSYRQDMAVDQDADAVIMSPMIANSAVYVGTYDYGGPTSTANASDDVIRVFAMSPVIRLVSTGIYPFDYKNYTGGGYKNITMLDHDKIFMNPTGGEPNRPARNAWIRKLQVWVTGQNSKWEEVREVLKR